MTNPTTDLAARFEAKREECEMFEREAEEPFARQNWRGRTAAFAIARDMARAGAAGGAGEREYIEGGDWSGLDPQEIVRRTRCEATVFKHATDIALWRECCDLILNRLGPKSISPPPAQQGSSSPPLTAERVDLGELERLSAEATQGAWTAAKLSPEGRRRIAAAGVYPTCGREENVPWTGFASFVVEVDGCDHPCGHANIDFVVTLVNAYRSGHLAPASLPGGTGSADEGTDLVSYLERQWAWSKETFGPALRTKGIVQHITKELREIEAEPHDLAEWVDVIILAMDGFWRHGGKPADLLPAMQAKQDRNFARTWPDWRTMGEDQAIEHDRSGEAETSASPTSPHEGEVKSPQSDPVGEAKALLEGLDPRITYREHVRRIRERGQDCIARGQTYCGGAYLASADEIEAALATVHASQDQAGEVRDV